MFKFCLPFFLISLSFSGFSAADNTLDQKEIDEGWQLLFDGQTLSQWRGYQQDDTNDKWQVEDGAITLTSGGGGDLISQKQYQNFDFKVDWKISEAGNSGIFILADERERKIYANAPEIQLLDNERHYDNKQHDHLAGSLYDMIPSPPSSHRAAGEWNQTRIKVYNRRLSIWHNEEMVADITFGSQEWNTLLGTSKFASWPGFGKNLQGHIGFQDHGDKVQFKNIKIKPL